MRKVLVAAPILALAISGCATKKFVRTEVGTVNDKVETLSKSVEENQERTRQNEGRIGEVDAKAAAAGQAAQAARTAADAADKKAADAGAKATDAGMKFDAMDKANRRLIYEVVLTDDQATFKSGQTQLADEAKAQIDSVVSKLKADPKAYYLEIEGHTDSVGSKAFNQQLGLERAEAVKRYIYETHQVPLHKINVISYGEDKPAAENNRTRANRALNRRVVIKVLA
jgi:outer membrane protein OmpA-like peptidoglycan-associated protein